MWQRGNQDPGKRVAPFRGNGRRNMHHRHFGCIAENHRMAPRVHRTVEIRAWIDAIGLVRAIRRQLGMGIGMGDLMPGM